MEKQWLGLSMAKDRGMHVVVHTSIIPWVNEQDLAPIARRAGRLGADLMALTPPSFEGLGAPYDTAAQAMVSMKRTELGSHLAQIDVLS
jgi:hypothetical protein